MNWCPVSLKKKEKMKHALSYHSSTSEEICLVSKAEVCLQAKVPLDTSQ